MLYYFPPIFYIFTYQTRCNVFTLWLALIIKYIRYNHLEWNRCFLWITLYTVQVNWNRFKSNRTFLYRCCEINCIYYKNLKLYYLIKRKTQNIIISFFFSFWYTFYCVQSNFQYYTLCVQNKQIFGKHTSPLLHFQCLCKCITILYRINVVL